MIVFVNGSFGVGKTTIANQLAQTIPNSLLFDPEEIGFMLRKVLEPIDQRDDFQHYPMWRTLTVETAKELLSNYNRTLVIPMTIWRIDYFREVTDGLSKIDSQFYHFCLTAPADIIRQRIRARGDQPEGDWIFGQVDNCVKAFQSEQFEIRIDSSINTPEEITQIIQKVLTSQSAPPLSY
jgi:tRNA uridine 5-carbamoylmethylation protein Kti12